MNIFSFEVNVYNETCLFLGVKYIIRVNVHNKRFFFWVKVHTKSQMRYFPFYNGKTAAMRMKIPCPLGPLECEAKAMEVG